jgi:hypothetical protein
MKRVYSSHDSLMAGHIKNILELQGVECIFKQPMLSVAFGELPIIECYSDVWITDDSRYKDAIAIVESASHEEKSKAQSWICAGCGEEIEGMFAACWNCGAHQPDS